MGLRDWDKYRIVFSRFKFIETERCLKEPLFLLKKLMSENYFWSSVKLNLIFPLRLRKHGFCFSLNYGNIVTISLELELYTSELNMNLIFLFIS